MMPPAARTARSHASGHVQRDQRARYDDFWASRRKLRGLFRFDVRYRCRRMGEVLRELGIDTESLDVLDVGFGSGAMLAALPRSCRITGADVGRSAVEGARSDPDLQTFASSSFVLVDPDDPENLPPGPFDLILSSHSLEHVPNDHDALVAIRRRLKPGGHLVLFVPVEPPDYIRFHLRSYSLQSVQQVVRDAGLAVRSVEGSMQVNGHVWKLITIPSRRQWPVVQHLVDGLRLATLSALPYPAVRLCDTALDALGVGARQALVVARQPESGAAAAAR
jgi:2-polyprenyl-3-methyl-5-hydroxy-6-metoxy-1,4-benzoquinol methylase